MEALSLKYDVLSAIISYLPMRDALRLSVTTRGLHTMAVQQALSHVKIVGSHDTIRKFCSYILAEPTATPVFPASPSRLSHLRSLELLLEGSWKYQIPSALITDLLMQLRTSPNFWSLFIGPVGRLQSYESQFIPAISALPCLKMLELRDWSAYWLLDVLSELRSPLSRLALTSLHGQSMSLLLFLAEQPLLEGLALLDLSGFDFTERERLLDVLTGPQWHTVRDLSVTNSKVPLSALVHAFPNIRVLRGRAHVLYANEEGAIYWEGLDTVSGQPSELKTWQQCSVQWLDLNTGKG